MLPDDFYYRTLYNVPIEYRRDFQSFFSGPATTADSSDSTFNMADILFSTLNFNDDTIPTSFRYQLNIRYWPWLRGRVPDPSLLDYQRRIAEAAGHDPLLNNGHPYISQSELRTLSQPFFIINNQRYTRMWELISKADYYNPDRALSLTEFIEGTDNGSTSLTKTLNTHDTKSVITTNTLERTGTETTTPTGSETSTNTRTGTVTETPTGNEVTTNNGVQSKDYTFAFDTSSGEDSPGSPVGKRGQEMTTTTSFSDRKTSTTYDNLKDESTRTFASRSDTLTRDTKDLTNTSVSDGTDHTGTVTDAGTSTDITNRERTLTGHNQLDLPDMIMKYRRALREQFYDLIMQEWLDYMTLSIYDY